MPRLSALMHARLATATKTSIRVVQIACFIHLVNEHVFEIRSCAGPSMYPTLALSGDYLLSIRPPLLRLFSSSSATPPWQHQSIFSRGDLIDFVSPQNPSYSVCKRVIGVEGDVVCFDPSGEVRIPGARRTGRMEERGDGGLHNGSSAVVISTSERWPELAKPPLVQIITPTRTKETAFAESEFERRDGSPHTRRGTVEEEASSTASQAAAEAAKFPESDFISSAAVAVGEEGIARAPASSSSSSLKRKHKKRSKSSASPDAAAAFLPDPAISVEVEADDSFLQYLSEPPPPTSLPNQQQQQEQQWIRVPKGYLWVTGDNLSNSSDSRLYGPVPVGLVRGKIVARVWPDSRWLGASRDKIAVVGPI